MIFGSAYKLENEEDLTFKKIQTNKKKYNSIKKAVRDFSDNFLNFLLFLKFLCNYQPFIDTTQNSSHAHFFMNMIATMAQFERDLIKERTKAGLVSARMRGQVLGRPSGISEKNKKKAQRCARLFKEGILSVSEICEEVGVSRATYYKYLRMQGVEEIREYKNKSII